ncbi:MAG: hypothetical protein KBE65_03100 [Phycisphaerae bacterium]|nr:hypothetical protein [Phycisphaerae bacterium]
MRVCIVGHAGVGKSPISKLFKVDGWEPFRVRKPRSEEDKAVCKTPAEYETLLEERRNKKRVYTSCPTCSNDLKVFNDWSFFKVRGDPQCLQHTAAAKERETSLRVEIFAPVLVEMIENRSKITRAFHLAPEDLVIIMLNPDSVSFEQMMEPSIPLCLATHTAVSERNRVQGKPADLSDMLKRIDYLTGELEAWGKLKKLVRKNTIECLRWTHFEYRYSTPCTCLANAQTELIRARTTLLRAIHEQTPHLEDKLVSLIRSETEILALVRIV